MTAVQNNHTHINKQKVIISIFIFSRITGKWKSLNFTRGMQSICQSVLIRYCVTSAKHIDEILIPPDNAIISSSLRILMWSPLYVPLKQMRCKICRLSIAVSRKLLIWPRPKATVAVEHYQKIVYFLATVSDDLDWPWNVISATTSFFTAKLWKETHRLTYNIGLTIRIVCLMKTKQSKYKVNK